MKKLFREGIVASVISVFFIAIIDIWSSKSKVFGSEVDYTNGLYTMGWWNLFFKINMVLICIVPLIYYFMVRKDKSETIALFLTSLVLWFSGLPDVLYFWLQFKHIPWTLPWLNNSPIIGYITNIVGLTTVTSTTLILSVLIGLAAIVFIDIQMEKIN
jgi:hypothetical protein